MQNLCRHVKNRCQVSGVILEVEVAGSNQSCRWIHTRDDVLVADVIELFITAPARRVDSDPFCPDKVTWCWNELTHVCSCNQPMTWRLLRFRKKRINLVMLDSWCKKWRWLFPLVFLNVMDSFINARYFTWHDDWLEILQKKKELCFERRFWFHQPRFLEWLRLRLLCWNGRGMFCCIWSVFGLLSCYSSFTVGLLLFSVCSLNKLNLYLHTLHKSFSSFFPSPPLRHSCKSQVSKVAHKQMAMQNF